jgi:hypothetical protein
MMRLRVLLRACVRSAWARPIARLAFWRDRLLVPTNYAGYL